MTDEPAPRPTLFRKRALEHFAQSMEENQVLKVSPPWTWALFWTSAAILLLAIVGSIIGRVEKTERGRGTLRPSAGVRNIQALTSGTVAEVSAKSGDRVGKGDRILRIQSFQLEAAVEEARRKLGLQSTQGSSVAALEQIAIKGQIRQAKVKLAALELQLSSHLGSLEAKKDAYERTKRLFGQATPLVSLDALQAAKEGYDSMVREQEGYVQQVAATRQELSTLENQLLRSNWSQSEAKQNLLIQYEVQQQNLTQTILTAPMDGYLEALVSRQGDVVQAGQTLAKLVPENSPLTVVGFVAEKDRAYIHLGDEVALELDAYPFTEFGTIKGRLTRISSDPASPYEVRDVLGDDAKLDVPSFRVEMSILDKRPARLKQVTLRPGMFLQARFTLRKQPLILLIFEPLRRWFE